MNLFPDIRSVQGTTNVESLIHRLMIANLQNLMTIAVLCNTVTY